MSTLTIEMPDVLRSFIDLKVRRGDYASPSEMLQGLVAQALASTPPTDLEAKLLEGIAEDEQGLLVPWNPAEAERRAREYLMQKKK